jgi:hypothetical protein
MKTYTASDMGLKGGSARTEAKQRASRENGKLGCKFEIVENSFHGGRHVAYAKTMESGYRAIRKLEPKGCSSGNCVCGGLQLVFTDGHSMTEDETMEMKQAAYNVYNS